MIVVLITDARLTADVELTTTPGGKKVGKFTVAAKREFKTRDGERESDFVDIETWEGLAESCHKGTGKGMRVNIRGRLETGAFDDSQGIRRKFAKVVADWVEFIDRKENS